MGRYLDVTRRLRSLTPKEILVLGAASLACCIFLGLPSAQANSSADSAGVANAAGGNAPVQFTDPSAEGYVDPIDSVVDLPSAIAAAQKEFTERYGGAWIDRAVSPPNLVIGVVNGSATDESRLSQATGGNDHVVMSPVKFSLDDLDNAKEAAGRVLIDAKVVPFDVTPSITEQAVVITVRSASADLENKVRASIPNNVPVNFNVDPGWVGPVPTNACRSCYPPYMAGLGYVTVGGAHTCTTGFAMKNPTSGQKFGTVAGHCGHSGDSLVLGGNQLQSLGKDSLEQHIPANADVARFQVSDADITHLIYTDPGSSREVTSEYSNSSLVSNLDLCFQGASSGGANCGSINANGDHMDSYSDPVYGTVTLNHAWCTDINVIGGDSGGPVYHVRNDGSAIAAGSVSFHNGAGHMCFSGAQGMENEMDVQIITG